MRVVTRQTRVTFGERLLRLLGVAFPTIFGDLIGMQLVAGVASPVLGGLPGICSSNLCLVAGNTCRPSTGLLVDPMTTGAIAVLAPTRRNVHVTRRARRRLPAWGTMGLMALRADRAVRA